MRWEDERYVRLYTRDTVDWEMMPWQSRALFPLLLRKVDRAGIMQLGKHGAKGLALAVGMPLDVVETGMAGLLEDGSVEMHGDSLVIRNFIEAQETPSSDAQRKRDSRERHRTSVTKRDSESQNVTESHERSRTVTSGHSVPICADPIRTEPERVVAAEPRPPLPFSPDAAVGFLAAGKRFIASRLNKGQSINASRLIRDYPDSAVWKLVGEWLGAGGEGWRQTVDVRSLGDFPQWVEHARAWHADGRRPIGKTAQRPFALVEQTRPKPKPFKKSDIAAGGDS